MGRPDFPRTIVEFQERFSDEAACLEYLAASRWPDRYRCPACDGEWAWVLARRHLWECARCHHQASVTAGTVLHGTRTPLRLWFWAAYLVTTHTPGISAKQLQRQLGLSRYETAWLMLQKLRRAMVAPERTQLRAEVEVDEGFVGGVDPRRRAGGRARVGKRLVAVAVEVRGQGSGRLRLAALPDASKRSLGPWVASNVEPGAIVHTDGWSGYAGLAALGFDHRPIVQRWRNTEERQVILPRAHRALANLKTWLQGTHRRPSAKHLQVYLDEFVFRHNRRRTPMAAFQTLLGLGAIHSPTTYAEITGHQDAA
ncbi:MAG: IS1595 family transposase [Solirubrobacterales bacterium]